MLERSAADHPLAVTLGTRVAVVVILLVMAVAQWQTNQTIDQNHATAVQARQRIVAQTERLEANQRRIQRQHREIERNQASIKRQLREIRTLLVAGSVPGGN